MLRKYHKRRHVILKIIFLKKYYKCITKQAYCNKYITTFPYVLMSIFITKQWQNPHVYASLTLHYGTQCMQWTQTMNILGLNRSMQILIQYHCMYITS
jgi:hypothetical protein